MDFLRETQDGLGEFNPCLLASLRFIASCASFAVLLAGVGMLVAWLIRGDIPVHAEFGSIVMRVNPALAFVCCAICLSLGSPEKPWFGRAIAYGCAVMVLLTGSITVLDHMFGYHVFPQYALAAHGSSASTSRNAIGFAVLSDYGLIFVSLSLFATLRNTEKGTKLAQFLAGAAFLIGLMGLMEHILNPRLSRSHMPITTAACFSLIAIAIIFAKPAEGVMKVIAADGLGGSMARRLVPAAILVSLLITWLRWRGQSIGYYDAEVGAAIGVAIQVVLFAWLILANGNYLEKADQLRKRAEEVARRAHEKAEQRSAVRITELAARIKELEK